MATMIELYTSTECVGESNQLRTFLEEGGYPFFETDLTTHPDLYTDFLMRFGDGASLPGVLWNGRWFGLEEALKQQFYEQPHGDPKQEDEDATFWELQSVATVNPGLGSNDDLESLLGVAASEVGHDYTVDLTAASAESPHTSRDIVEALPPVPLPNGNKMPLVAMTRLLMNALPHALHDTGGGNHVYAFRGYEGLKLWSAIFFLQEALPATPKDVENFGRMLMKRGIIHNCTPVCNDFSRTCFVLTPLKNPTILNQFVKWPVETKKGNNVENPMDTVLRLSCLMDELISHENNKSSASFLLGDVELYQQYEVACCQLQMVDFPQNKTERAAFMLNLFNLIARHAMLIAANNQWSFIWTVWPKSLNELSDFLRGVGYNVGGIFISLAYIQERLYGTSPKDGLHVVPAPDVGMPKPKTSIIQMLTSCGACTANLPVSENEGAASVCFQSPVARNDHRMLFAMSWGTRSSPTTCTIFPNRLKEGLQHAAQLYVQTHVHCNSDHVELPVLLAWHRRDFGTSAAMVLESIMSYMSVSQLRQLDRIKNETGELRVKFQDNFDWKPGMGPRWKPSTVGENNTPDWDNMSAATSNIDGFTTILERATSNYTFHVPEEEDLQEQHPSGQMLAADSVTSSSSSKVPPAPTLTRRQTSSSFLGSIFRRPQASQGEPPVHHSTRGRKEAKSATDNHTEECTSHHYNNNSETGRSFRSSSLIRSDVSELTLDTEFQPWSLRTRRRGRI